MQYNSAGSQAQYNAIPHRLNIHNIGTWELALRLAICRLFYLIKMYLIMHLRLAYVCE